MIAVLRQGGVEGEVDLARQLFVGPGGAEGPAVQHGFAAIDLQPRDARLGDGGCADADAATAIGLSSRRDYTGCAGVVRAHHRPYTFD